MIERETVKNCNHPWTWMMVSSDGGVKPCCWAPGLIGNLNDAPPEVIWNGALAQELRASILRDEIHPICANSACKFVRNMSKGMKTMNVDSKKSTMDEHATDSPLSNPVSPNPTNDEPISQMASLLMTRDDVCAAFRLFLNRDPKSEDEITPFLGATGDQVLATFLRSKEFILRKEMLGPLAFIANKFLEKNKLTQE